MQSLKCIKKGLYMYIHRSLENRVIYMAEHFPAILVSGARQVGKTTLLKKITEDKKEIYPPVR